MLKTFPIFAKELYEVAERKNTYFIRVFYACVIGLLFYLRYDSLDFAGTAVVSRLGYGAQLYQVLLNTQFVLILLVVPPLVASAITIEKENRTLTLLLTLPITSGRLLAQKLAGRLIPVFSLILIGLPLFGFSFLFGGVTSFMVLQGTINCMLVALSVGSLAIAISTLRDHSGRAILETYAYLLVLGPTCLSPIIVTSGSGRGGPVLIAAVICLLFVVFSMSIANAQLRKRADNQMSADKQSSFAQRDFRKHWVHKRPYPDQNPFTWLEIIRLPMNHKEAIGLSVLVVVCIFLAGLGSATANSCAIMLPYFLVFLSFAALFRTQQSVLRFRNNQSLPVILTLPITADEIIKQFLHGRRYELLQAIMFLCLLCVGAIVLTFRMNLPGSITTAFVFTYGCAVPLIAWLYFLTLANLAVIISVTSRTGLLALAKGLMFLGIFLIVGPLFLAFNARSPSLLLQWQPVHFFQTVHAAMTPSVYQPSASLLLASTAIHLVFWFGLWVTTCVFLRKKGADWLARFGSTQ